MKYKVALIVLGHAQLLADLDYVKNWKSEIFSITACQERSYLRETDIDDGYYDVKYSRTDMVELVSCPEGCDLALGIMPYRFIDNFYLHGINDDCAVLSLYGIQEILQRDNISIEHFIIKQLYEICAIKHLINDISSEEVDDLVHRDTRGCLFDMNGERSDIIYNTEHPIICEECKGKFRSKQIDGNVIGSFEKELKRIKKPKILRIERWIRAYPLLSIIISAFTAILLNIVANIIYDVICKLIIQ